MSDPIIKIQNMNKWFGDFQVLKNINLEVEANKKIVVCGPSGSGISTLIRCINRLEEHQEGCLLYTSPSPRDGLLSRMPSSA